MIRKAFLMQVNANVHEEYERRHNPIWAELKTVLTKSRRFKLFDFS